MATVKPSIEDFDNWTEENEEAAFDQIRKNLQVKHLIKGDTYWAITPDHTIYQLPLLMSIPDFEALSSAGTDVESIEQIKKILTAFAGAQQAEKLEKQPIQVVLNLISDYATAITKAQGANLGK